MQCSIAKELTNRLSTFSLELCKQLLPIAHITVPVLALPVSTSTGISVTGTSVTGISVTGNI